MNKININGIEYLIDPTADEIGYTNNGMSGVANVKAALDYLLQNIGSGGSVERPSIAVLGSSSATDTCGQNSKTNYSAGYASPYKRLARKLNARSFNNCAIGGAKIDDMRLQALGITAGTDIVFIGIGHNDWSVAEPTAIGDVATVMAIDPTETSTLRSTLLGQYRNVLEGLVNKGVKHVYNVSVLWTSYDSVTDQGYNATKAAYLKDWRNKLSELVDAMNTAHANDVTEFHYISGLLACYDHTIDLPSAPFFVATHPDSTYVSDPAQQRNPYLTMGETIATNLHNLVMGIADNISFRAYYKNGGTAVDPDRENNKFTLTASVGSSVTGKLYFACAGAKNIQLAFSGGTAAASQFSVDQSSFTFADRWSDEVELTITYTPVSGGDGYTYLKVTNLFGGEKLIIPIYGAIS